MTDAARRGKVSSLQPREAVAGAAGLRDARRRRRLAPSHSGGASEMLLCAAAAERASLRTTR